MTRPQFRRSDITGRQGVSITEQAFLDIGWPFRDQPISDLGIDAIVEVVDGTDATGKLLGLQIKSGPSFFAEPVPGGWRFRGEPKHLDYWRGHTLPVVLVLCDVEAKICYWVEIGAQSEIAVFDKSWTITVPEIHRIDKSATDSLRQIAELPTPQARAFARLAADTDFMRLIEDEHEIRLTVEEWVNKSSGRGSFELIDATDGDDIVLASWSGLAPGWDYGDLIAYLVPWADVDIDDEFYEDFDRARFDLECGTWDHEDDRYYHFRDYNEWRDELPRLRPYESAGSGEVDQYRLMLDLNDVGKSWLTLLKFAESEGTALK